MSGRTGAKIRSKIIAMYEAGIAKTFVTLTFVNAVTDPVAVRCLAKLLKLWRDQWGKFNFLWVAERQNSNKKYPGNIHFHLVLDRIIDIKKENARWARLQYNSGIRYFVSQDGTDYLVDPTAMSNEAISKYLNPLDVDRIRSSQGLSNYLTAYVTKSVGDEFKCRIWHCSGEVSALFTSVMCGADMHREFIKQLPGSPNTFVYKKEVRDKRGKIIRKVGDVILPVDNSNDHCSWVYIVNRKMQNSTMELLPI